MTVDGTASAPATRRISGVNGVLWFVGLVLAIIMVASAAGRIVDLLETDPDPAPVPTAGPTGDPVPDNGAGVYAGSDTSQLMLPTSFQGQPLVITRLEGASDAQLELGDDAVDPDGFRRFAGILGQPGEGEPTVIAFYERSTLWIVTEGDWVVSIEPFTPDAVADPTASGVGQGWVLVPSDASVAVITSTGDDGPLWVDALTIEGYEILTSGDAGDPPLRFEWTSSPYVLFNIYTRDDTEWTIDVLEDES